MILPPRKKLKYSDVVLIQNKVVGKGRPTMLEIKELINTCLSFYREALESAAPPRPPIDNRSRAAGERESPQ